MNLTALLAGGENDFPDKGAKGFRRLLAAIRVAEGIGQAFYAAAVQVGKVRMNVRHIGGRFRHAGGDFSLLPFKLVHAGFHARLIHAVFDGGDDPGDCLLDLGERLLVGLYLCAPVAVETVHFLRIGFDSFRNRFAGNEPLFQARQHTRLNLVASDGAAIVAGAAPVMVEAGIAVRRDDPNLASAASAGEQAGKQMHWAVRQMHALHAPFQRVGRIRPEDGRYLLLTGAGSVPQFIVHDSQVWNLRPDPCAFGIDA